MQPLIAGARGSFFLGMIFLASALLAGCDFSSPSSPDSTKPSPESTTLPNGLAVAPIPEGASLATPGRKSGGHSSMSPYGCILSTPNLKGDTPYRREAVYLRFPASVVKHTEGLRLFTFRALSRTAYTDEVRDHPAITRIAHCRVPDSDRAEKMAHAYLERFPKASGAAQWTGQTLCGASKSGRGAKASKDLECTEYEVSSIICLGPFNGNPETCFVELTCTEYVYVEKDDEFGGGSGDDLSSPEPCNSDGDLSGQLCVEGGGSVPTGAAIIENPCDQPNPPDYCSEAGSCFDANIGNAVHETILKVIEDQGALNQLWTDSNFDQSESNRLEQGGFLVPNSYNDGFTFQHLQPSQITQQTPCKLGFQAPSDLPAGTIYAHTHPYTNGERQNACPTSPKYDNAVGVKDRPALQQMNLEEGFIIDADQIIFYQADGNDPDGYATYDRCGY